MDLDNIKFSKINSLQGLVKSKNGILEPSQKVAVDPNSIDADFLPRKKKLNRLQSMFSLLI